MSNKLMSMGYKMRYIPDAVCHHLRKDSLISAVDTCYNWRKSAYEISGAYEKQKELLRKGLMNVAAIENDISGLIDKKQFEILYPDFLHGIRTLFKDMHQFYKKSPTVENRLTCKAGYIILAYLLINSKKIGERLTDYILDDISDLVSMLSTDEESGFLKEFRSGWKELMLKEKDVNQVLAAYSASAGADFSYLSAAISEMSQLFGFDPVVYKMIETSARRMKFEEVHSPYDTKNRIMLLNPPWNLKGRRGVRAGSRWPFTGPKIDRADVLEYTPYPFFLGYLSSLLKEKGLQNAIVDGVAEDLTDYEFIERVAGYEPDIIVMEVATASYLVDTLWLLRIKERLPKVKVIWTGAHVTTLGEKIIGENPFVDFIIRGEYEKTTAELIKHLLDNSDYEGLSGIMFINDEGKLIDNGKTELADLDNLPLPERLAVPIYKYNDLFAGMPFPSLQLHASRGCPFGCIYCVWPQVLYGGKRYRTRTPKLVVDEIETVVKDYGFRSFYFDDDTFNIGRSRVLEICAELVRRNLAIPWGIMARADTLDYEMLKAMKQAGMIGMKLGVESGDQRLVDTAEKGLDLNMVGRTVGWCRELGIMTHLTFTFGLPGETADTIRKTIDFAKEMNPDTIQFSITTPFPGTKYFDLLKQQGNLLTEEWDRYDGALHTVISSDTLSRGTLEEAVRQANEEFWAYKRGLSGC